MLNSLILLAGASAAVAQADYSAPPVVPPSRPSMPTSTAPQSAPAAVAASPSGRTLQALPNTTVRYYEVTGKNPEAIKRSIAKQRPKGSDGEPVTASTAWDIGATFTQRRENGQCKITSARATFAGTAELPKLTNERALRDEELESWRSYVAGLEAAAAARLWFIHDRLPQIEKAILASSCEQGQNAGAAAVEQLQKEEAEFVRTGAAVVPAK